MSVCDSALGAAASHANAMHDIFISYARPDQPMVEALAEVLAEQGWSVWWDRSIPAGQNFDETISAALDQARCVVVLWSSHSIASDWVREEALEGAQRRILVPVLIEDVRIPLGFRRIQAARLENWQKGTDNPEFRSFVADIATILGDGPPPRNSLSATAADKGRHAERRTPATGLMLGRGLKAAAALLIFAMGGVAAGTLMADVLGMSDEAGLFGATVIWLAGLVVAARIWTRAG